MLARAPRFLLLFHGMVLALFRPRERSLEEGFYEEVGFGSNSDICAIIVQRGRICTANTLRFRFISSRHYRHVGNRLGVGRNTNNIDLDRVL